MHKCERKTCLFCPCFSLLSDKGRGETCDTLYAALKSIKHITRGLKYRIGRSWKSKSENDRFGMVKQAILTRSLIVLLYESLQLSDVESYELSSNIPLDKSFLEQR